MFHRGCAVYSSLSWHM